MSEKKPSEYKFVISSELKKGQRIHLLLLPYQRDMYVTEIIYDRVIGSRTLKEDREGLRELGLIEEYERQEETSRRPRLYLRLTSRGRALARLLMKGEKVLTESREHQK